MPPSIDGSLLPDDDWNRLQQIADQFASARQKAPVDDWLPYIPARDDRLHRPVLFELVKIDLELSWRTGGGVRVETYIERFPGLDPVPAELVVEEYRLRHRFGDKPALEEYRARFPDIFSAIEKQLQDLPAATNPTQRAPAPPLPPPPPPPTTPRAAQVPGGDGPPVFPDGYRPIERIGRGNFGEVWKAEAPGGVEVAIKIVTQPLEQDGAQREQQALELIKKLQHPALLSTLAFWVINNHLVIAMELADGSLRDRLKECKQKGLMGIPAEELLTYFRDAAVGLDYLHWQKVLHRDIKPENILLKKGYAKVADFGLAKGLKGGVLTSSSFAGTPAFMAPEAWAGRINERSDQYSLAFTYAELRLGRRPLEGDDFMTVMKNTQEQEPNLGDLPKAEQTVLRRGLHKRPEERYESCQDFVEALDRVLSPGAQPQRRRPSSVPVSPRSGPESRTESTERSLLASDVVPTPIESVQKTVRGEPSVTEPAKAKGAVWKPPGPTAAPSSAARGILLAIVGLLVVVAGAFAVWKFVISSGPSTESSTTSGSQQGPTTPSSKLGPPTEPTKTTKPIVETADFLPPKLRAPEGEKLIPFGAKKYYEHLVFPLKDRTEAVFILLRPGLNGEPRPFYVMENKVWNNLFAEFKLEHPGDTKWFNDGPWLPARNVTLKEAEDFAAWLGGQLPTPAQWDHAAGFTRQNGRTGPAAGQNIAVGLAQPRPVNIVHDDISPLSIRDLSGNGREFTRERRKAGNEDVVILRGRMFTLSKPLTYADLTAEQNPEMMQTQFPNKPSPYTGFRVVIEVP